MRKFVLAAAIASTVLTGGVALAQTSSAARAPAAQDAPQRPNGMMRADRNGDGVITRDEAIAQATRKFDKMDTNHDGKLTATELAARGGRGGNRMMANGGYGQQ